jgi:acyl carrier protein
MSTDTTGAPGDVFAELRAIVVETLGVDEALVTPEAALIEDLGAESIDFIDLAFRVEKAFGIKLPTREWGEFVRRNRGQLPIGELAPALETGWGVRLTAAEQEELGKYGLKPMCDRIAERHRVTIPESARLAWARQAMEQHAATFERLFAQKLSGDAFERLVILASRDVYAQDFTRAVRQLFTVGMLCRFIEAGAAPAPAEG